MLDLPDVTLLFVETRAHAITKRVIEDCLSKVNFGDVLIYTDKPDLFGSLLHPAHGRARYLNVIDFLNKREAGAFYYQHACAGIETDFALMLEWDAGIYDTKKWKPEFLNYDYIGAPWIVRPEEIGNKDVGNGGFTIMSKRLGKFMHENALKFPAVTDWDLCRDQRQALEAEGFKWPDRNLAAQFSWELGVRDPENFGFHGAFNWPYMLEREEVVERAKIMLTSPYLIGKMRDLIIRGKATWLEKELGEELWTKYLSYHPAIPNRHGRPQFSSQQRQNMGRLLAERQAAHMVLQSKGLKA